MRHLSQFSPTLNRLSQTKRRVSKGMAQVLSVSVSVLAVAALSTPNTAWAQGEFSVDISQPGVSIDYSVLDDGGLAPQTGAPVPAATSGSVNGGLYKAPGANAPVSQLYVQPAGDVNLPPQTKSLIAKPAPIAEPDSIAEDTPEPTTAEMEPTAVTQDAPEAAEPADVPPAAEVALPEAPVAAEPAAEAAQETAKVEPTPQEPVTAQPAAEPTPQPAPQVTAKAEPAPMPEPTPEPEPAAQPAPEAVVDATPTAPAEQPTAMAPPPPPQALTQDQVQKQAQAQAPAQSAATPEAVAQPTAPSKGVVVALPPKLEDTHPGVASLPPASGPLTDGDSMRLVFENDSSKLPADARDALKALASRMAQQDNLRLQLLAYAGDTETSASAARRLSLSRALAVRSFLIENGVRSTRIDVRALGNKSTEDVTERVDITVVER